MKIFLCGYMGCGKSTVANLLAQHQSLPFEDLDAAIEVQDALNISEIFRKKGEIYFRRKEKEVLKDFLNSEKDFVLALGGGTVCYGENLQLVKDSSGTKLIYLKSSAEELTERLFFEKEKRPLISHLATKEALLEFIQKHLFERSFYYNQSDIIIKTDGLTPAQISAVIAEQLD